MPRRKIAVITAKADDLEQRTLLWGITGMALSLNTDTAVFSNIYNHWVNDSFLNFENHIYDFFRPEYFDGVIVTAEAFPDLSMIDDVMIRIRKSGIPAVIIGGEAEGFISVTSDDEADMEQIAEHLITVHGFTRIDILTGPADNSISVKRAQGCIRAFERHSISPEGTHTYYGNFWNDSGEKLAEQYLSGELPMPQAVICTNDYMAFGLCDTLTAAGIPIPERITVTGYDQADGRIYHYPLLTTYRRNRLQMGEKAAANLLSSSYTPSETEEDRLIYGNTCSCGVNSAQLNEEMRCARVEQYHSAMISVAQFANKLTVCRSLAEYTAVLKEFFYLLHYAKKLYLCLDKAWNSAEYEGEEFLCCGITQTEQDNAPQYFKRNVLLPALWEDREKPMVFFFNPLCFQTKLFGYTVVSFQYPQVYDFSFQEWNKTVANTLEFLRMKNDIHYLTQCQRVSSLYDSLTGFYHLREFRKITETAGSEISGQYFMQAVRLSFSSEGEFLYGENYRSDIIAAVAGAVKQASGKHEICCRAADDLFLILCRSDNGRLFSDKLKVMIHNALCGRYDETQVIVTYTEYIGNCDADVVDSICHTSAQTADEAVRLIAERNKLPHYNTLLPLRTRFQAAPKNAPSTEEICRKLCISDGYFRVAYKKCFGISYVQDCIHARIMLACYLLCTTAMSIYAVARKCGYTDEKYFARQFRQNIGCSPVQYRELYS